MLVGCPLLCAVVTVANVVVVATGCDTRTIITVIVVVRSGRGAYDNYARSENEPITICAWPDR